MFRQNNCAIFHADPPSPPLSPKLFPQSLTSAVLSWTSPNDSVCVISYIVSLINATEGNVLQVYNTTTHTNSKTVSNLTQGVEYSFIVAGIDRGGRVGEKSMSAEMITLESEWEKLMITILVSIVTNNSWRINTC